LRQHVAAAAAAALALASALLVTPAALAQEATPLPEVGTDLEPGRYASDVVGPTIAFDVDEGWQVGPSGPGPIFTLLRADEPGTVLSVTRFDGEVFVDSCDPTSLSQVETSVPRLMTVIAGNPYLNPGAVAPIEVDGHEGLWLDVATPAYTECALEWLLIWALPVEEGGEFVQVANQQARFIGVDVDGTIVVVAIESLPGTPFGELLESSLELVASMSFEAGPTVQATTAPDATPEPASTSPLPSAAVG
jgi:hypothetical protein